MWKPFLAGAITMGFFTAALFFLRFWRRVHDRFFLFFAVALWILAAERVAQVAINPDQEFLYLVFCLRLAAFLIIIFAIVDKNR